MYLELLSPARNLEIGIAAIDSGADAVYIGGPFFGARKDAGNSVEDIAALCSYAHRFGARVFVTFNISVSEEEIPEMHGMMLACQMMQTDASLNAIAYQCGFNDYSNFLRMFNKLVGKTPSQFRKQMRRFPIVK